MLPRHVLIGLVLVLGLGGWIAAPALAGDVDGDGVDDAFDICINTPPGVAVDSHGRPFGDLDGDCDTDLADYALVQQGFTGPLAPPPPPEGMDPVPAGEYQMGDHHDGVSDALPVHVVYIDAFYLDRYEVTNQQYAAALNWAWGQGDLITVTTGIVYQAGTGTSYPYCSTTSAPTGHPYYGEYSRITWNGSTFGVVSGKETHPVVVVSWYGAVAYANWRSVMQGRPLCYNLSTWTCDFDVNGYRLPTEAEWEKAARGGLYDPYRRYPWGDTIDGSKANYWASGDPYETGAWPFTTPVGYYDGAQYPPGVDMANGYGLYDMAGNVWELCNDWYSSTYYSSSPYDNPRGPASGVWRVVRGGSWYNYTTLLRCAFRNSYLPADPNISIGFRLALDAE
jgi:sulfatase modifying factor 1